MTATRVTIHTYPPAPPPFVIASISDSVDAHARQHMWKDMSPTSRHTTQRTPQHMYWPRTRVSRLVGGRWRPAWVRWRVAQTSKTLTGGSPRHASHGSNIGSQSVHDAHAAHIPRSCTPYKHREAHTWCTCQTLVSVSGASFFWPSACYLPLGLHVVLSCQCSRCLHWRWYTETSGACGVQIKRYEELVMTRAMTWRRDS